MNDGMEIPKELQDALHRVVAMEKMELSPLLDYIMKLKNHEVEVRAAKIYATKEILAAESGQDTMAAPSIEEKNQLTAEIDDLHSALVTHKLVGDTLQEAVFKIQMQEAVNKSLRTIDTENLLDDFPEKGVLLSHCSQNLDTCKTLQAVVQEKEELDREILDIDLKYKQLLKDIKKKWSTYIDGMAPVETESEQLTELRRKAREREAKLRILSTMLQGLISTSGLQWGSDDYLVEVLHLCDIANKHCDHAEETAVINSISELREQRESGTSQKGKSIQKYFTSTPSQRKKSV
nr:uncharacterized protein LOC123761296 [Procambarus clarkii]XP_045603183.1 uncharacterized protein LOC123761296 [Procambarus clarkii]